jgi:protein O-mannosyl-transferase
VNAIADEDMGQVSPDAVHSGTNRGFDCLAALLVVAVLAVYLRCTWFDFIYLDDLMYVCENRHVLGGLTVENIAWSFTGFHDFNWIPFTWLSLMLDADLHGSSPGGYHLTNVLLHTANSVLLFAFLVRATRCQLRSAFVAALFALHPLHVESVAWIAERKDVLSIFFGLLSLHAYVTYSRCRQRRSLLGAFAWFACSLMSKQTLVTLPFVFLLLDFWPLGRWHAGVGSSRDVVLPLKGRNAVERIGGTVVEATVSRKSLGLRLILEKMPFFAASVAFSALALIAQSQIDLYSLVVNKRLSLTTRLLNALVVYVTYLWKMINPHDLVIFYSHPGHTLTPTAIWGSAALLALISVGAAVVIRRWPFVFVGWTWYLGTLVPMIGLIQVGGQQMADRYTYFPLIGVFLAITWLVPELVPDGVLRRRALPIGALAALCALGSLTFVQIGYWRDGLTVLQHAIMCQPTDAEIVNMLGNSLLARGNKDAGLALLKDEVRRRPRDPLAHVGLAMGLDTVGRSDEAAEEYRRAIAVDDTNPEAQTNLAGILCARGQYQEAKLHLLRAIQLGPTNASAYAGLGWVSLRLGEYSRAVSYSETALRMDADQIICHYTIAKAQRAQGQYDAAIRRLEILLKTVPGDAAAQEELELTLAMKR